MLCIKQLPMFSFKTDFFHYFWIKNEKNLIEKKTGKKIRNFLT